MISVIIVTWNCEKVIKKCLESIRKYMVDGEIIVVDNDSKDNTCKIINELDYDNLKLIELDINEGFAKGNNIGVEYAKYDNVLLLNPDTILLTSGVEKLTELLNDKVGIVGCRLLNENLTLQPSCYMFDTPGNIIIEQFQIGRIFLEKIKERYAPYLCRHKKQAYVDWIMGAFMLMKKNLYKKVEGFSEDYFLYSEDMDICYKLKKENKKVMFFPDYEIIHIGGQSEINDNNNNNKFKKMLKSRSVFAEKYGFFGNMKTFYAAYTIKLWIVKFIYILTLKQNIEILKKCQKYENYKVNIKKVQSR